MKSQSQKRKYLVFINLSCVSEIIVLRKQEEGGGWWDTTGNFGWAEGEGPRSDSECYEFVTEDKKIAEAFRLGAKTLANRLRDYLA
jgi:hypothetical protein